MILSSCFVEEVKKGCLVKKEKKKIMSFIEIKNKKARQSKFLLLDIQVC